MQEKIDVENRASDILTLRNRAWEKDYFTSALPWTQKGNPAAAPLTVYPSYEDISDVYKEDGTGEAGTLSSDAQNRLNVNGLLGRIENLSSSLSGIININDFRVAHHVQKWLERQARAGSRYTETIQSHFGVHTGDARLQRPEYLGGGKNPVVISEVLNTNGAESAPATPQGNMAGHGISVGSTNKARKMFTEHGFIMGIMSVMPVGATYQQGIHKMFNRIDKYDYYWPEFAHLSEQAIKQKELFLPSDVQKYEDDWGYQQRYAEYKYKASSVHGDFRDNLSFYHAGRIWAETNPQAGEEAGIPTLNEEFIKMDPTAINERIFAAL